MFGIHLQKYPKTFPPPAKPMRNQQQVTYGTQYSWRWEFIISMTGDVFNLRSDRPGMLGLGIKTCNHKINLGISAACTSELGSAKSTTQRHDKIFHLQVLLDRLFPKDYTQQIASKRELPCRSDVTYSCIHLQRSIIEKVDYWNHNSMVPYVKFLQQYM